MYFPLLRGKQFELLALRELSDIMGANNDKISPIIEPVRESFSSFRTCTRELISRNINFNIILNPNVGGLRGNSDSIINEINSLLEEYSNFQIAFYINGDESISLAVDLANLIEVEYSGITLIHNVKLSNLVVLEDLKAINEIKFNILNSRANRNRRYYKDFEPDTPVILDDHFNMLPKNSDYLNNIDELFTDEHLYYQDDGYVGFSDYLTIGASYAESGFLPYAVVIHITYEAENGELRIRHFVSDSNDDNSDVAGKFNEALTKLIEWLRIHPLDTIAIREFVDMHETGHFPGLGVVKKLSIMHHLETVIGII